MATRRRCPHGGRLDPALTGLDPSRVVALAGDVASEEHRLALRRAVDELGGLDAIVHNASRLGPSPQPPLDSYPLDAVRDVDTDNVFAPLRLTQLLLPVLRTGKRIVFVTSDASVEAYAATSTSSCRSPSPPVSGRRHCHIPGA